MRLKFNREVRKSIADELKKISTFGGIGLGVLGYSMTNPLSCWARSLGGQFARS